MNTAKKTIFVLSLVAILAVAFVFVQPAKAQSAIDIMIANIKQQIAVLQQQLANLENSKNTSTAWCYTFNRNLKVGESGMAVVNLQTALNKEGLYSQSQTGMFDEQLASAVVAFQEKYASAVLTPSGLTHGTGFVGPSTRAELNSLYGCGINPANNDLTLNNVSGPATLGVNQSGTWTVSASDPDDANLSYYVTWGDTTPVPAPLSYNGQLSQTATFTHAYAYSGNFTITFTVRDAEGNTATKTATVSVGTGAYQAPTANSQSISVMENSSANIYLAGSDPQNLPLTYSLLGGVAHGSLSGSGQNLVYTPSTGFVGGDSFTFKVNNGTYDSNSATVSINVTQTSGNMPSISGVSGPVNLNVGQTGTWTVSVSELNNSYLTYSVTWGDENRYGAMAMTPVNSYNQSATFTHSYYTAGNYNVIFRVTDSSGNSATSTLTVSVH